MLISLDDSRPLQLQIYENLRSRVLSGVLKADVKLPASRELANNLSVSRTTVLNAYDRLTAEGYIYTRPGAGSYVSTFFTGRRQISRGKKCQNIQFDLSDSVKQIHANSSPLSEPLVPQSGVLVSHDFRVGQVAMDSRSRQVWSKLMSRCFRNQVKLTDSHASDPHGYYPLRQAIADHLQHVRNCNCHASNIVITQGAQQAFDLLGRLFLNPGDTVAVENPSYFGASRAFLACQAKILPVDVDSEGMSVDQLAEYKGRVKLVYVTPSHQFPSGCVMSLSRRMQLVDWARENNACIIEDDYDSEFHYGGRPLECIQATDPDGHTIYVGTFSKVLSPSLRLGYVVLPESVVEPFAALRWIAGMQYSSIQQQTLALWMTEGYHHQHLHRMRKIYRKRRDSLLSSIAKYFPAEDSHVEESNTGLHILLWLHRLPSEYGESYLQELQDGGVALYPAIDCYQPPSSQWVVGLGFGFIEEEDIEPGIKKLSQIVSKFYSNPGLTN